MKVKMLTLSADPIRVLRPGDVVELAETEAQQLINGGYAVAIEKPKTPKKKKG